MPVDVAIAALTAQRQDVHAFDIQDGSHGLGNREDDRLKPQIFLLAEIARDLLQMRFRANQNVADEGWVLVQESDGEIVFEHDVVSKSAITRHKATYEARPISYRPQVFLEVEFLSLWQGRSFAPNSSYSDFIAAAANGQRCFVNS